MIESPKGPAARPTPGQRTTTPPHTEVVQRQLVQPPGAIMTSGLLASTGAMRRPDRTVTVPGCGAGRGTDPEGAVGAGGTGAPAVGGVPPGAEPPGACPPGAGAVPPGAGAVPPGCGAVPPGVEPPGVEPPGVEPPGVEPPGAEPPVGGAPPGWDPGCGPAPGDEGAEASGACP